MVTSTTNTLIAGLVQPANLAVDMRESSMNLVRLFAQQGYQFALVTDDGRPMGMIRRAMAENEASEDKIVGQMTVDPLPAIAHDTMTLAQVMQLGIPADLDRIPVINAEGLLVGELPRTGLNAIGGMENYQASVNAEKLGEVMQIVVKVGDKVIGSDGHEIGTVKDIVSEVASGHIGQILIEEGALFKKDRTIPVDLIDPTFTDGRVHLKVNREDVDRLTPLGEQP